MIKHQETFNKWLPANYNGKFDWDYLLPIFKPTKIEPTDIDGVVERKGKFLFFETKKEGKSIPLGQLIMLETLIKRFEGDATLLIIYGKTDKEVVGAQMWRYENGKVVKDAPVSCDWKQVYEMVYQWWCIVNKRRSTFG